MAHNRKSSLAALTYTPGTGSTLTSFRKSIELPQLKTEGSASNWRNAPDYMHQIALDDRSPIHVPKSRISHCRLNSELILRKKTKKPNKAMIEKSIIDYTSLFEIGRKALTPSGTSTKLGPGCYNVPSTTLGGQAFQFGTTSRFKRLDVFTPAWELDQEDQRKRIEIILQENKEMEKYLPDNREKLIRMKSEIENARIIEAKKKKELLVFQKRLETQLKLDAKQRKFEYKIRKDEIYRIAKSWTIFLIIASWNTSGYNKMVYRKDLHFRSEWVLKRLYVLCLSIGKFKRLRKLLEIRRAKSKIVGLVRPIRKFVDLKRNLYSLTTIDIIERAATKDMLFRLLAQWKHKIIFIQRTMKYLLFHRKTSLTMKKLMWNKVEFKMHRDMQMKRNSITVTDTKKPIDPKALFGKSNIPDEVKEIWIKKLLAFRVKEYISKLNKWKQDCRNLKEEHEKNKYKRQATALLSNKSLKPLKLPDKPRGHYMISDHEYKRMILECTQNKEKWFIPVNTQ